MKMALTDPVVFASIGTLLLPLAGAFLLVLLRIFFKRTIPSVLTLFLLLSFAASIWLVLRQDFSQDSVYHFSRTWFSIGTHVFKVGFLVNGTSSIMALVVTLIAMLVSLYSQAYMKGEEGQLRYYGMIGFFTFSMLGIVFADNLVLIFVCWELVGFSSYALINHFYTLPTANAASMKAFLVNRIGDAGFLIGIAILWVVFGTSDLEALSTGMKGSSISGDVWTYGSVNVPLVLLTVAGIGIFSGAIGKSAQFPLQVWLPDAMAGPTPVSALIHAATMVAAGVFLLARVFPILGWDVLQVIAVTGAVTAFMGAVAAMTQHDIKRVLAYSTISQLGYMVMGLGTGAYDAALFHLFTHAFFKAGLFLAAGSVIYGLHSYSNSSKIHFDAQDMRQMGGLRKYMPVTFVTYTVLAMSLAGLPLFSGFLSKDAIILGSFAWAGDGLSWRMIVPVLGLVTVALTAFYMMRQLLLVFFGEFRAGDRPTISESPRLMRYILIFLSMMSLAFVWSLNPLDPAGSWLVETIRPPLLVSPDLATGFQVMLAERASELHLLVTAFSIIMIGIGGFLAYRKFSPGGRFALTYREKGLPAGGMAALSYYNWHLDSIYKKTFTQPVLWLSAQCRKTDLKIFDGIINASGVAYVVVSNLLGWIDKHIIDGLVNFTGTVLRFTGKIFNGLARGNIQYFILVAVVGVILLIWLIN